MAPTRRDLEAAVTLSTEHLAVDSFCPPMGIGVWRIYSMKFCPFAQRTRLVMLAKNIKHEIVNIHLKSKPGWFFEKNPLGKVPILEKDGQIIYESLITCDFLEEVYPDPPLYPKDSWQKAKDRIFIDRFASVLGPYYKIRFAEGNEEILEKALKDLHEGLDIFEVELKKRGTKFFLGDKPGMLDYMIWPWIERLALNTEFFGNRTFLVEDRVPNLISWKDGMLADPVVQAALISREAYSQYRKTQQYDL